MRQLIKTLFSVLSLFILSGTSNAEFDTIFHVGDLFVLGTGECYYNVTSPDILKVYASNGHGGWTCSQTLFIENVLIDHSDLNIAPFLFWAQQNDKEVNMTNFHGSNMNLVRVDSFPESLKCPPLITLEEKVSIDASIGDRNVFVRHMNDTIYVSPSYIVTSSNTSMYEINVTTGSEKGEVNLTPNTSPEVYNYEQFSYPLAFDGSQYWLNCFCGANTQLMTEDGTTTFDFLNEGAGGINFAEATSNILYVAFDGNLVIAMDISSKKQLWSIQVSAQGLALSRESQILYILCDDSDGVLAVDANSGEVIDNYQFQNEEVLNLAYISGRIYALGRNVYDDYGDNIYYTALTSLR